MNCTVWRNSANICGTLLRKLFSGLEVCVHSLYTDKLSLPLHSYPHNKCVVHITVCLSVFPVSYEHSLCTHVCWTTVRCTTEQISFVESYSCGRCVPKFQQKSQNTHYWDTENSHDIRHIPLSKQTVDVQYAVNAGFFHNSVHSESYVNEILLPLLE
jgi:hypothetical protein